MWGLSQAQLLHNLSNMWVVRAAERPELGKTLVGDWGALSEVIPIQPQLTAAPSSSSLTFLTRLLTDEPLLWNPWTMHPSTKAWTSSARHRQFQWT